MSDDGVSREDDGGEAAASREEPEEDLRKIDVKDGTETRRRPCCWGRGGAVAVALDEVPDVVVVVGGPFFLDCLEADEEIPDVVGVRTTFAPWA